MRTKLIINPAAGRGNGKRFLGQIISYLQAAGVQADFERTESPGQAVELARRAANEGYERVVAVGGDGTAHEVLNGLLIAKEEGNEAILGIIPIGSGNDFSYGLNIPQDLAGACRLITNGEPKNIDVVKVLVDGVSHYCGNTVGLGFDAEVNILAKRMPVFRGFMLYLMSVFLTLAKGRFPYAVCINDGKQTFEQEVTLIAVSNGKRTGGGFFLTPNANFSDGNLDFLIADKLGRIGILNLLPKVIKGTHLKLPAIHYRMVKNLLVEAPTGIAGHIDGEVLCVYGRRFEFQVIPLGLMVWN